MLTDGVHDRYAFQSTSGSMANLANVHNSLRETMKDTTVLGKFLSSKARYTRNLSLKSIH